MSHRSSIARALTGVLCATALLGSAQDADAFCGFYVSGGEADLFNDATQVVLLRDGTKTVLSMQNNYEGPAKGFAMVVPVPQILMQEDVQTLEPDVFDKIDKLSAPRLVEYFEEDPCYEPPKSRGRLFGADESLADGGYVNNAPSGNNAQSVTVEAQFAVGEYDVSILSATEATGLETWLTENAYNIPSGAAPVFNQYIEQGMYFFVAKVDPAKVTFEENQLVLSPLRFSYDSPEFSLPIRLGMVNSSGEQDLIVYTLGENQRFEVSNYPNATIPTNTIVDTSTRESFGEFYTQLFSETLAQTNNAVITEYAWDASSCDPCPGPTLDASDITTFGADILDPDGAQGLAYRNWVLTRLHARYSSDGITEDLVFRAAGPIVGGRGTPSGPEGELGEKSGEAQPSGINNFQGRYIMLNPWEGEVRCSDPNYGVWGGNSGSEGSAVSPNSGGVRQAGGGALEDFILEDIGQIGAKATRKFERGDLSGGCGCSTTGGSAANTALGLLALLGMVGWRRRRR